MLMRYTILMYLKRIAGIVMLFAICIWFLSNYPQHETPIDQPEASSIEAVTFSESTYIHQLGRFIEPVLRPLGFSLEMDIAIISGFVAKEVVVATFGVLLAGDEEVEDETLVSALRRNIPSHSVALGFLVFILLYTPCLTTVVTIQREAKKWYWTTLSIFYQTGAAYLCAWLTVNISSFFFA